MEALTESRPKPEAGPVLNRFPKQQENQPQNGLNGKGVPNFRASKRRRGTDPRKVFARNLEGDLMTEMFSTSDLLLYPKVNGEEALGRPLFLFTVDPSWRSVYSRLNSFQRIGFVGTLVYQPLSRVCPSSRLPIREAAVHAACGGSVPLPRSLPIRTIQSLETGGNRLNVA